LARALNAKNPALGEQSGGQPEESCAFPAATHALELTDPALGESRAQPKQAWGAFAAATYGLAIIVSLSVWFLAIRAPLWLDETGSYWCIAEGLKKIWPRSVELNSFPAYYYVLWLTSALFGSSELALRIPSVLAMLGATYLFYRCARELFELDAALIACLVFILDARIAFAAIDARPYAFALLVTNLAILVFLRWWKTKEDVYAPVVGLASAAVFYFHYLFGCLALAFLVCYPRKERGRDGNFRWPLVAATASCALGLLPLAPRLWILGQTRNAHVFAHRPEFIDLLEALFRGATPFVFVGVILIAASVRQLSKPSLEDLRRLRMCLALALVPMLTLYGLTVTTPIHIFVSRYEAVAVPGIALCWAWVFSRIRSRRLRILCCAALVAVSAYMSYTSPNARSHGYTWKYALEFANKNAAYDNAPLVICSDLPEADFQPLPTVAPENSVLFSPLGYYKIQASVIPLPRALNEQAQIAGEDFLSSHHERFLVLAHKPSRPTIEWFKEKTSANSAARVLAVFDDISVVEFAPRNSASN